MMNDLDIRTHRCVHCGKVINIIIADHEIDERAHEEIEHWRKKHDELWDALNHLQVKYDRLIDENEEQSAELHELEMRDAEQFI